jgi:hypothetical protein
MKPSAIIKSMTPQNGKVLRYVVDSGGRPIGFSDVVNHIHWSDLPHSVIEAKICFNELKNLELVQRQGKKYVATVLGSKVVSRANKNKLWQTPPSPEIVNQRRK